MEVKPLAHAYIAPSIQPWPLAPTPTHCVLLRSTYPVWAKALHCQTSVSASTVSAMVPLGDSDPVDGHEFLWGGAGLSIPSTQQVHSS